MRPAAASSNLCFLTRCALSLGNEFSVPTVTRCHSRMWQFYLFAVLIFLFAIIFHTNSTLNLELLNIHSVTYLLAKFVQQATSSKRAPAAAVSKAAGTPVKRTAPHLWASAHTPRPLWVHHLVPHFSSW